MTSYRNISVLLDLLEEVRDTGRTGPWYERLQAALRAWGRLTPAEPEWIEIHTPGCYRLQDASGLALFTNWFSGGRMDIPRGLDPKTLTVTRLEDTVSAPVQPERIAQKGSEGQEGAFTCGECGNKFRSPRPRLLCGACQPRRVKGITTSESIIDHTKAWLDGKEGLVPHE